MTDGNDEALYSETLIFRTTRAMLAMIDLYAGAEDRSRSQMLRRLVAEAVTARQLTGEAVGSVGD